MKQRNFLALPACATLLFCEKNDAQSLDYRVHFRYETAIFPQNLDDFQKDPGISAEEVFNGQVVRFVQFYQLPDAAARQRMADGGFKTLDYISFATWRTAFPADLDLKILDDWNIRSVMPIEVKWKLSSSLSNRPLGPWAVSGEKSEKVAVIAQVLSTVPRPRPPVFFMKKRWRSKRSVAKTASSTW